MYFHGRRKKKHTEKTPSFYMDLPMYIIAATGPIMTIPQIYNIWDGKSAQGLSLMTWTTYTILSVIWLGYGIRHKENPIVFGNFLACIVNAVIMAGIVLYSS